MRKERKILYDYWQNLQTFKEYPEEIASKIIHQPIREDILVILRNGLEEEINDQKYYRYAMSANELLDEVNKRREDIVKKTNLYFHLKKLEDSGFIREVVSYIEGNHKIRYFGRTAKLFTFSSSHSIEKLFMPLKKILVCNKTLSELEIEALFGTLKDREQIIGQATLDWIESNIDMLDDLHIDLSEFSKILSYLTVSDKQLSAINRKIMVAIDLNMPD